MDAPNVKVNWTEGNCLEVILLCVCMVLTPEGVWRFALPPTATSGFCG